MSGKRAHQTYWRSKCPFPDWTVLLLAERGSGYKPSGRKK